MKSRPARPLWTWFVPRFLRLRWYRYKLDRAARLLGMEVD